MRPSISADRIFGREIDYSRPMFGAQASECDLKRDRHESARRASIPSGPRFLCVASLHESGRFSVGNSAAVYFLTFMSNLLLGHALNSSL